MIILYFGGEENLQVINQILYESLIPGVHQELHI